jgi:2-polyprenyl-6-methoxyphenol hydroxylase-like FAD-dependent oxidoreductase
MGKKAIIIGAGPAGLTAALEFLRKTNVQPIVLEAVASRAPFATRATAWTSVAIAFSRRAIA